MKTRIFLFIFLILILVRDDLRAFKREIKPHYVIIRSSYRERIVPPKIKAHTYDPLLAEDAYEPYLPEFKLSGHDLPENFPENKEIGWLSKAMPKLSEFFFKEEGILENAILLYQRNELSKAEEKLESILSAKKEISESARLRLGWIKFKKRRLEESLNVIRDLYQSEDLSALREAYYLSSLILIKKSEFKRHLSLMKSLRGKLSEKDWGFRLNYCLLISLIETKDWPAADKLLQKIEKGEFYHAKLYYKIKEAAGVIRHAQKNYQESLDNYLRSAKLNFNFKRRKNLNRNIAWLYYLTKQFDKALKVVELPTSRDETDEELLYLKLACLTQFQDWEAARNILEKTPPKSDFYFYSAVKLRLCFAKTRKMSQSLKKAISTAGRHFPEERFYVRLLEGVDYFRQKQYGKAEKEHLKAFSLNVDPRKKWIARYNLGLIHLKQKKFRAAEKDFLWLTDQTFTPKNTLLSYHLLYAWHELRETEKFLKFEKETSPNFPEKSVFEETQLMKASSLLDKKSPWPAIEEFMKIWKRTENPEAFEFAVKGLYKAKKFQTVVNLIRRNPEIRPESLFIYKVKSLLALQKFPEALKEINKKNLEGKRLIELRLEVLQANQLHKEIIDLAAPLLKGKLSDDQRLLYYLSMGDAYFNLKKYAKSKNQFHKALALTKDSWQKSMIFHNIALSAYYYGDYSSFLKEVDIMMNNPEINGEIKYNLTQLLVKYYRQTNQWKLSDSTLEKYVQSGGYQRVKANIKRIHLLYKERRFKLCFELSAKELKEESAYNRRDRIVMAGYCGSEAGESETTANLIETELKSKADSYRRSELMFILIQNYYNLNRLEKALKLGLELKKNLKADKTSGNIAMQLKLTLAAVHIKLNRLDAAEKELGDIEKYRLIDQYHEALFLTAEIKKVESKLEEALRIVFRVYYLPGINKQTRQKALLRLAELYEKQNMPKEAKDYLGKIDEELIMTDVRLRPDYLNLRNELR